MANSSTCSPKSRGWTSYSMFSYSVLALLSLKYAGPIGVSITHAPIKNDGVDLGF